MVSANMNFLTPPHSYFFVVVYYGFVYSVCYELWGRRGTSLCVTLLQAAAAESSWVASGNHLDMTHCGATACSRTFDTRSWKE